MVWKYACNCYITIFNLFTILKGNDTGDSNSCSKVKCTELTLVRHLPEGVDAGGGVSGGGETGHPRHHVTEQRP